MRSIFWILVAAPLVGTVPGHAEVISIRADEWCPFNCDPSDRPGYGIEIFNEAMTSAGHSVDYKVEPWTRALEKAKAGKSNAVIGANIGEISEYQLKAGKEAIGLSMDCVFARSDSLVKFTKPTDLSQFKRVGVINDYDYSEAVQAWIKDPKNAGQIDGVAGGDSVVLNIRKLEGGRIDAMIEDKSVMGYMLNKLSLDKKIVSVGCLKPAKLFIAFSGKDPKSDSLIKTLDATIAKLRASGGLSKIISKYGVTDWK